MDSTAPRQSLIQFGETAYAKVNACPHLWVRGKACWSQKGNDLLIAFMKSMKLSKAFFNGAEYGPEYLSLNIDQLVQIVEPPTTETEGWVYGCTRQNGNFVKGWLPPTFIA